MRIVVVTPSLPLPFGRADARWLHTILKELGRRHIDVTCISTTEENEGSVDQARALLESHGVEFRHLPLYLREHPLRRRARSLKHPFSELERVCALRAAIVAELQRGYDVLHVEHLFSSWATLDLPRSVVYLHHLEVVDWEGRRDLSVRERIVLAQMHRATRYLLRRAQRLLVASDRLADELRSYRSPAAVRTAGVALDAELYPMVPPCPAAVVGVIGSMHWYPSRSAAARVLTALWPRIHERVPDARLVVAGWNSGQALGQFFPLSGAELMGPVREPTDLFGSVAVLLYPPPKGSGMKIKVLEAMAYGVPVVSNREGLEGLEELAHCYPRHVAHGETDEELVQQTVRLLEDPTARAEQRREGRRLIEEHHSSVPAVDRLLDGYARLGLTA